MFCIIYRLRDRGVKLDKAAIQATEARGWISFGRHPLHTHIPRFSIGPTPERMDVHVEGAQLLRITPAGMMIAGSEWMLAAQIFRQVYWCVPCQPGEASGDLYRRLRSSDPIKTNGAMVGSFE